MTPRPVAPCADPRCGHDFYQHAEGGWGCQELTCFCASFQFAKPPPKKRRPHLTLLPGGKK